MFHSILDSLLIFGATSWVDWSLWRCCGYCAARTDCMQSAPMPRPRDQC